MRIACVAAHYPKLSETFVVDQVEALRAAGHAVDVFALRGESRPADTRTHRGHPMPEALPARALAFAGIAAKELGRNPRRLGAALDVFRFGVEACRGNLVFSTGISAAPQPYDAIHAHFGAGGAMALFLRDAGLLRGPIVTTFHAFDVTRRYAGLRPRYPALFARGDRFLAVSDFTRRALLALGAPPERTTTLRLGVDCGAIPFTEARAPRERLEIVSVGRLHEKKGFRDAILACAHLRASGIPFHYAIIGEGRERAALASQIAALGLGASIELVGARAHAETLRVMSRAHVLVAPSRTAKNHETEGLPVVLMEAMASGCPVVATRHAGIPELVEPEISGILVDEADPAGMASALGRIWGNPAEARARARAARDVVVSRYDLRASVAALAEALRETAASYAEGEAPYAESRGSSRTIPSRTSFSAE